jgi:hypothetical protein
MPLLTDAAFFLNNRWHPQLNSRTASESLATMVDTATRRTGALPDWPVTDATRHIAGVVRDSTGTPFTLGAVVILIRDLDGVRIAMAVASLTDGSYEFLRDTNDPYTYTVHSYWNGMGGPIEDVTKTGLVPSAIPPAALHAWNFSTGAGGGSPATYFINAMWSGLDSPQPTKIRVRLYKGAGYGTETLFATHDVVTSDGIYIFTAAELGFASGTVWYLTWIGLDSTNAEVNNTITSAESQVPY